MPTLSHYAEVALYADATALLATSRKPSLLVSYLETYLSRLENWLQDWRITFNVSKSTALLSAKRLRDASKSPDQSSFSERQYSG
jgi:hypothetical protein